MEVGGIEGMRQGENLRESSRSLCDQAAERRSSTTERWMSQVMTTGNRKRERSMENRQITYSHGKKSAFCP